MSKPLSNDVAAAIAATRFGPGARPGELEGISRDPYNWLFDPLRRPD